MSDLVLERPVFAVGGRVFRWAEVVRAAELWGDWAESERAARDSVARLRAASQAGVPLHGEEFDDQEKIFRRARRLLAAEELIAWLERRGVALERWRDHLRAAVLRRRAAPPPPQVVEAHLPEDELGPAVWAEAMCSGALEEVARRLAARAAVAGAAGELRDGAEQLTQPDLAEMDRRFAAFCERAAGAEAVQREIDRHRLDWVRLDWRYLAATDDEVLRELALCVREDGLGFEQAAAAAGIAVQRRRAELEAIDAELSAHLLGAHPGALLGPLAVGGEQWLVELLDRRAPSSADPEVVEQARRAVIARAVEGEVADRVSFSERVDQH